MEFRHVYSSECRLCRASRLRKKGVRSHGCGSSGASTIAGKGRGVASMGEELQGSRHAEYAALRNRVGFTLNEAGLAQCMEWSLSL